MPANRVEGTGQGLGQVIKLSMDMIQKPRKGSMVEMQKMGERMTINNNVWCNPVKLNVIWVEEESSNYSHDCRHAC